MRCSRVYPAHAEAKALVFEPLQAPPSPQGQGDAGEEKRRAYEEGLAEGRRLAEETLQPLAAALAEAARRMDQKTREALEALQQDALRLILAIARRVIMAELKTNPQAISDLLRNLLRDAEGRKVTRVRLNPSDIAHLEGTPAEEMLRQAGIQVLPAEEIAPGGCVLETGFGRLDARLEVRLDEVASALLASPQAAGGSEPPHGQSQGEAP